MEEPPEAWRSPAMRGWGSPGPRTKRLFPILTPDRQEGAREAQSGPGLPCADGAPCGRTPWGRGGPGGPAYRLARAQRTRSPLPPSGFLRPGAPAGEVAGRREGGGDCLALGLGRAAVAPVGGTTSEPPRCGGRRSCLEVGGRGGAWPARHTLSQPGPLLRMAWTVPQPGRSAGHLHVVSMYFAYTICLLKLLDFRFLNPGFQGFRAPGVGGRKHVLKRLHLPAVMG